MVSQDNRLLPLPAGERGLERPLGDLSQSKPYGVSASEPTHLRDYLFVVLKRKWLILTLVVVVTSLVTVQMYRQPSVYQASAMILIDTKTKSVLQTGQGGVVINTGGDRDPAYWNTQLKLLENPALARQVILTLDLHKDPAFFGSSGQTSISSALRRLVYGEEPTQPALAPETNKLEVVDSDKVVEGQLSQQELTKLEPYENTLAANLSVDPVVGTNLVNLRYRHSNPELAQRIVNTYADTFAHNNAERMTTGNATALKTVGEKIAELQAKIEQDEAARFNYIQSKGLPFSQGSDKTMTPPPNIEADKLARLSTQLLDEQSKVKVLRSLYETAVKASDPNDIPSVAENKRIQDLRGKLDTLRQKRDELLVIYQPEWPEVRKVDAQIKMLEDSLNKAPKEVINAMKANLDASAATEARLRAEYASQNGRVTQNNRDMLQLSVLNQRIENNRQFLNTFLQRKAELENQKDDPTKTNNVTVTQYSRSGALIGPARTRNVIIALLLSLGIGIGLAFLLDYLDDTLKSIEDVDRYVHLPALALIPSNKSEQRARLKGKGHGQPEPNETTALALINDVRSPIAEAYRHLRTSLLLSSAGQPPKTILITSSQPSEGKTTTAVNTAVMLAQTGAEVLIIDCDLRRPRLHAHFNVPNAKGVTNFLSGDSSELDDLMQPYEKLPNLKLLTSGAVPPNPAELLGSDEMRKMLSKASDRFTHVVIDSPPAISFTDASILSTMVDGVVLVVHGGRSSRAVVRRAKQQLLDVGANIFGVVLNNVKLESTNYYYYAGYYSSYYTDDDGAGDASSAGAGAAGGAAN
ncbi:MAG TPA: polysaccharide biosynthesis tyrosine autokinase [Pyrinomonadaceae bacterium]|nr:polysaccharide biosynthesis tyrosine autokinase [Pyrinomonadaceae bacterium]